uniref:Uncharacterized protein n=1 Tax=Strongyloides venezuelensis TaxID=75913 RepID=A0A0K0G5L4_STRVS
MKILRKIANRFNSVICLNEFALRLPTNFSFFDNSVGGLTRRNELKCSYFPISVSIYQPNRNPRSPIRIKNESL